MSWHAEAELLERYARGTIEDATAFSLEAHLTKCANCRTAIAPFVDVSTFARTWDGIVDRIDAPHAGVIEGLLLRFGVSDHVARLLAATPSLRASWLLAVATALGFAVLAAHQGNAGVLLFLALAPLLPVAGVASAYGPGMDPAYEIGLAAPMRSFRLLLIRSGSVLTTTTVLAGAAALFLPGLNWTVAAWLLPSLALTIGSLALATFVPALWAFGSIAAAWITLVLGAEQTSPAPFAAFRAPGQLAFVAVVIAAGIIVVRRRESFDTGRES